MKTITIIDTGISIGYELELKNRINKKITCCLNTDNQLQISNGAVDNIGHGTLVCSAINTINKNTILNIIKICGDEYWADEEALIAILKYIAEGNIVTDILHISCGIQCCDNMQRLDSVIKRIKQRDIIIVAAFSNSQIISYPAACNEVIGVAFDTNIVSPQKWIYVENSPINIFATGNPQNLIDMNGKIKKVAGASFAAAFISAHIAKLLETTPKDLINQKLKEKAIRTFTAPCAIEQPGIFEIKKIVIFPFNKENHSIVRNINMLKYELMKVLDLKYFQTIGKDARLILQDYNDINNSKELIIEDIMEFDWTYGFDTFVLGHIEKLEQLLSYSLIEYICNQCIIHKKNLYSYDPIPSVMVKKFHDSGLNCYYPMIVESNLLESNCGMLYEISKPVVGVFGTSSKQGKWSLQKRLQEILTGRGYNVGHLGTEPHAKLFENTEICAIGFNSIVNSSQTSVIATFNYLMHKLEHDNDLIIIGAQSNTIQASFGGLATIPMLTHELIWACEPQASILCINEWDEIDYIERSVKYLESFSGNKVIALAYFFKNDYEKRSDFQTSVHELKADYDTILNISKALNIKAYNISHEYDMEMLCDKIVNFF